MLQYLVVLGATANFLGSVAYVKDTLSGKTKPNRITFLMWSIAPFIGAVAALSDGVRWSAVPVFMSGFCPFMIFLASFMNRQAQWQLHWFDYVCGILSLMALILWGATHQPIIAIVLAIVSDTFAGLPTIKKSWTHPETETPIAYVAAAFAAATSFFAIKAWRFAEYAFPGYLLMSALTILLIIYCRRAHTRTVN